MVNINQEITEVIKNSVPGIIKATIILFVGNYSANIAKKITKNSFKKTIKFTDHKNRKDRVKTIADLASNTVKILIMIVTVTTALSSLNVDIGPLLAGAGILGLAVGFGAQTLVKDMVNGFFIILENQYNIDDTVEVAGFTGVVKSVSIRTTILEDKDGNLYYIPNSQITKVKRKMR